MPEYIDREALIKKLEDKITNPTNAFINNVLIGLLEKAPAADVAEVVRCNDCKFYNKKTGFCLNHSYFKDSDGMSCSPADSPDFTFFNEDDFCSYGEMKDGETR